MVNIPEVSLRFYILRQFELNCPLFLQKLKSMHRNFA